MKQQDLPPAPHFPMIQLPLPLLQRAIQNHEEKSKH